MVSTPISKLSGRVRYSFHYSCSLIAIVLTTFSGSGLARSIDTALTSAHTVHRGDVIAKDWYEGVASPIRFERSKASLRSVPPKFGQHSAEVLTEFGYSTDEVEALMAQGVVCGTDRKR